VRKTPLDEAIAAVSRFLVADRPLGETLQQVAELAVQAIPPASAVGVTLLDDHRRPSTALWTQTYAPRVDHAQYEEGAGPCLSAYKERRTIRVDDVRDVGDQWPAFSRRAVEEGVFSTLSLPLVAGTDGFGAFNLYARTPGAFSAQHEADAEQFATGAAVVLANASAYWTTFDLASGLQAAMESRAQIEQAKGILMASRRCSPEVAFQLLVQASQRNNEKLRDIAARIVTSQTAQQDARA
jgi:transcriptional regulator with GAF, ATPase, and Fis domain